MNIVLVTCSKAVSVEWHHVTTSRLMIGKTDPASRFWALLILAANLPRSTSAAFNLVETDPPTMYSTGMMDTPPRDQRPMVS